MTLVIQGRLILNMGRQMCNENESKILNLKIRLRSPLIEWNTRRA
jgi:hypothetical protein